MKQDVNYITHHKNVNIKMMEDDLSPLHVSLYNALFLLWNRCDYDTQLSINRNDVMKLSKIGSANTYTSALKTLDSKGYIKYQPSFNPMKGSLVTLIRFDKGSSKGTDKGSGKSSDIGSGNASDNGTDTLYKQVKQYNNLTEEQTNIILEFYDLSSSDENELLTEFFKEQIHAVKSGMIGDDENLAFEKSKLIEILVADFGFSEMKFALQKKLIFQFVNILAFKNQLEHFNIQYASYKEFKAISGQKTHLFGSFIGTINEKFQDGAWNADNWSNRLQIEKEKIAAEKASSRNNSQSKFEKLQQSYNEAKNPYL
jgi:hypothetical protein